MGAPGFRPHLSGLPRLRRRRLDDDRLRRHPLYANARRGGPRIRTAHRGPEVGPAHDAPSRRGRPPRVAGEALCRGPARAGRARPQVTTKPRYGLTASPVGEICPVTRVVTGPPVSGASLIVPSPA